MARRYIKTGFVGVRYREYETRKHGVRPDRYFFCPIQAGRQRQGRRLGLVKPGLDRPKGRRETGEAQGSATRWRGSHDACRKTPKSYRCRPCRSRGPNDLVYLSANGRRIVQISETFNRLVAALGFNNGVTDPRQKVVFHTLRHTFASWLVEKGIDLYSVKELMGHGTLAMTERHAHLSPDKPRRAIKTLEAGMDAAKTRSKVVRLG